MRRIIQQIEEATGLKPIPMANHRIEKSIVYQHYTTAWLITRLQLRLMAFTYAEVEELAKQVLEAIEDFGGYCKVDGIASIQQNGGGMLYDEESKLYQRILYFDIVKEK